ncbi:hypothetical protein P3T16_003147 [Paraburkholderia sp. GAS42]
MHPFADGVPARTVFATPLPIDAIGAVSNDENARLAG